MENPLLEIRNITKTYPGSQKKANNNISLKINKGEILCIAGDNGAGKTTLMKILCGLEKPDSGEIIYSEKTVTGMVHQHFVLFPDYSVAQNITIKNPPRKMGIFFDNKKANEHAQKIIDGNSFSIKSTQKVKDLTLGQMQQVEICRVLYTLQAGFPNQTAGLIILDEPTAILTEEETQSLFNTMRQLVKEGNTIIFITHKMPEINQISDRVIILKNGEVAGINESLHMPSLPYFESRKKSDNAQQPVIEFKNVTVKRKGQKLPLLDNVSFSVHKGEILGFTGTGGNGLGVIEAVLGGFLHPAQGFVLHNGRDVSNFSIRKLRKNGLSFVPSDRKLYGSAQDTSIKENLLINLRDIVFKNGIINQKKANEITQKLMRAYNIKGDPEKNASTLSGGNLQKLILAREINMYKDYLVFSEPTWGLDAEASVFILNEIKKLKENGAAVILISTNAEEVHALADRVIIMNKGKIK